MSAKAKKRRKKQPGEKTPGDYFFWGDWETDTALKSCDYAAQGFWMDCLCKMRDQAKPFMLPGDMDALAGLFGMPKAARKAWGDAVQPLLDELEAHGVFTRGREIDERLPDDAIVCRRFFREWVAEFKRSEDGRAAAKIRWQNRTPKASQGRKRAPNPSASSDATPYAKGMRNDATPHTEGMRQDSPETDDGQGFTKDSVCDPHARSMPIPNLTQPSLTKNNPQTPGDLSASRGPSSPTPIASTIPNIFQFPVQAVRQPQAPSEVETYSAILSTITGDPSFRKPGWEANIECVLGVPELRAQLDALMDHVAKDTSPYIAKGRGEETVRSPARLVSAAISEWAKMARGAPLRACNEEGEAKGHD